MHWSPSPHPTHSESPFRFASSRDNPHSVSLWLLDGAGYDITVDPPAALTQQDDGLHRAVTLTVPAGGPADDELRLTLAAGTTRCVVHVRRTGCVFECGLLGTREAAYSLPPGAEAALRWFGFGRYAELVLLAELRGGLSGSRVLVARPRLRAGPGGLPPAAWGSCLLLKVGGADELEAEAANFRSFLADRHHPFVARTGECLTVFGPGEARPPTSVLISSFVGGEQFRVEPLELLVQGEGDEEECRLALDRLFDLLGGWYANGEERPLSEWKRVFDPDSAPRLVCGKYDFATPEGRRAFRGSDGGGLNWDATFDREHLSGGLLGKGGRPGLLDLIARKVSARFSLAHGDLHPRNVLAGPDGVWLIDFGKTGPAPTLFDFAKMEVNLRLWCLDLDAGHKGLEAGAGALERLLLDAFLGGPSSLTPVRALAERMGADGRRVQRVAGCIAHVRRRAAAYTTGRPDRRDYLAVLFLTVLASLRYAAREPHRAGGYRLLVALYWLLEEKLCRLLGAAPTARPRAPLSPKYLIDRAWLAAPDAPARVVYYLEREDGRRALPEVAALRGVLQNDRHRLDCFDHALLVLAHVEELLKDPWDALTEPGRWEARVAEGLWRQGMDWSALRHRPIDAGRPDLGSIQGIEAEVRGLLDEAKGDGLLLKWVALLHDAGKPATRCVNESAGKAKVQMLGHEEYGGGLLAGLLEYLFPGDGRIGKLIRNHAWPHEVAGELLRNPAAVDKVGAWLNQHGLKDLVLLLLHGYADRAACGGWVTTETLAELAACYLTILAACVREGRREPGARRLVLDIVADVATKDDRVSGRLRGALQRELQQWREENSGADEAATRAKAEELLSALLE